MSLSVDEIQMKATEKYIPVVLFIMLYMVVPTFDPVDEILKCDHSNERYLAELSFDVVYYALQGGSNFWVCELNPQFSPLKESYQVPISCGAIQYTTQVSNSFEVSRWTNQM